LDFLVRIERFQWVTLTPRPGISLLGSSPRNNGIRPLISRDRAPGGVRRRRLVCAVDRAFHGDEDHSTDSDYRKEIADKIFNPHETEDTRLWKFRLGVRYGDGVDGAPKRRQRAKMVVVINPSEGKPSIAQV